MIFWDNFKVRSGNATVTVTATSATVGSTTRSVLDLGDAVLRANNLISLNGITLPSGTTFDGPVTLPAGSSISNLLTPQQLTIPSITVTSRLEANDVQVTHSLHSLGNATIDGALSAETITVGKLTATNGLTATGSVSLPTNTTIGGFVMRPGPRQKNLLYVDGHFGGGKHDWVSIKNLSATPVYAFVQLYVDANFTVPYELNGHIIQGYTASPIALNSEVRVLEFDDEYADPFYTINGYVRIKYSTTAIVSDSNQGYDINEKVRSHDLMGDGVDKYVTYGTSTEPADWLRTVLYEDENEHWYVISCAHGGMFTNMKETMSAAPYNCRYILCNGTMGWKAISNQTDTIWGGVVGFKR